MKRLTWVKRLLVPAVGVLLTIVLVCQASPDWKLASFTAGPSRTEPVDSALPARDRVLAEGRVAAYPGAEVVVGAEMGGRILQLSVQEKSVVHKGDLIAEIQSDDLRASLAEAKAHMTEAESDTHYYRQMADRARRLLVPRAGSQEELDGHLRMLAGAHARRAAAEATAARYEALIAKTHILAPISGVITARQAHPGETVDTGARLVTIADLNRVRIEAEIDEFDAGKVALGAGVMVTAEGFTGQSWRGKVEEIPDSVTARRLKPEDPGRPADTRVLMVKVALAGATPLKLGQRVEIELDVPPSQ